MSDAAQTAELDSQGPDPLVARTRALAAARAAQTARTEMFDRFGITGMEVQLWCEQRGPKSHGLNVRNQT